MGRETLIDYRLPENPCGLYCDGHTLVPADRSKSACERKRRYKMGLFAGVPRAVLPSLCAARISSIAKIALQQPLDSW